MKMKAAVLYEQGRSRPFAKSRPIVIEDVDLEEPGPGEVLVDLQWAGLCHSDLSTIRGGRPKPMPVVMGHEGAGIVRAVGDDVGDLAAGDHVVLVFVARCGTCAQCLRGRSNLCETSLAARNAGTLTSGATRLSLNGRTLHHNSGASVFAEYAVVSRGLYQAAVIGTP